VSKNDKSSTFMLFENCYYVADPIIDLGIQFTDPAKLFQSRALLLLFGTLFSCCWASVVKLPRS